MSTTPFLSASRITGTTSPLRRVGGEADVVILLQDQVFAVERSVELGKLLQRRARRLDHERQHRHAHAALLVLLVELHAKRFELGDVGVVVVGDVRDHHPVAVQVRAGDLPDPRQRLDFDRSELREVDLRPRQQIDADAAAGRRGAARGRCRRRLSRSLDVFLEDAALVPAAFHLAEIDAELARQFAHAGTCVSELRTPPRRRALPARQPAHARRLRGAAARGGGCRRRGAAAVRRCGFRRRPGRR